MSSDYHNMVRLYTKPHFTFVKIETQRVSQGHSASKCQQESNLGFYLQILYFLNLIMHSSSLPTILKFLK